VIHSRVPLKRSRRKPTVVRRQVRRVKRAAALSGLAFSLPTSAFANAAAAINASPAAKAERLAVELNAGKPAATGNPFKGVSGMKLVVGFVALLALGLAATSPNKGDTE
jgi:hypothetical protein